jgi:hypothetical protein
VIDITSKFHTVSIYVIIDLLIILGTKYANMCMISQMPNSGGSSVNATKPKTKCDVDFKQPPFFCATEITIE